MLNENTRRTRQGGFTLIELVIVLIILGIVAAVAVPRFIDLSEEAENRAAVAQASALASGNSINVAACALEQADCSEVGTVGTGVDCDTDAGDIQDLVDDFDATRFSIEDGGDGIADFSVTAVASGDVGNTTTCSVDLN